LASGDLGEERGHGRVDLPAISPKGEGPVDCGSGIMILFPQRDPNVESVQDRSPLSDFGTLEAAFVLIAAMNFCP
jgi:hypothetical protein